MVRPSPGHRGHPVAAENRRSLARHTGVLRSLADLVFDRFVRWRRDGTWENLLSHLQTGADVAEDLEWTVSVDGTVARAHQHSAGARKRPSIHDAKGGVATLETRQLARAAAAYLPRYTSPAMAGVGRFPSYSPPASATRAPSSRRYWRAFG